MLGSLPPREFSLDEHSSKVLRGLGDEDIHVLRRLSYAFGVEQVNSGVSVTTRQFVGTIRMVNASIVIRPKLPIEGFLELLSAALGLPRLTGCSAPLGSAQDDVTRVVGTLFAGSLSGALRYGLVREYVDVRSESAILRGRLDAIELATRRFGLFPPLDCEYADFVVDTEPNRRLRAACERLLRLAPQLPAVVRRQLAAALYALRGVRSDDTPSARPSLADGRYAPFEVPLALANLVLQGAFVDVAGDELVGAGFLVDMNKLYEAWITRGVAAALRPSAGAWRSQVRGLFLDNDRSVILKPDIVWRASKALRIPVDAKYKVGERLPNSDIYQMTAYCSGLESKQGVFFCADVAPVDLRLKDGTELHVRRVSPGGSSADRRCELARAAEFLSGLVARRHSIAE